MDSQKLLEKLETIDKLVAKGVKRHNPVEHRDRTRARIAMTFTIGYFSMFAIVIVGVPIYNALVLVPEHALIPLSDTLMTVSGIIGGPIGFVIGFYFKVGEGTKG